ncbi:MAG: lipid-A-disaccharide synthase [Proteobacteria bacterium SG_bin7]|nr:MAG: lipid-A-disaccharide synthase [Proteobacteria bacterium SG_bin7]
MKSTETSQILIVAAEASSVLYAQRLLEEWKTQNIDVHAFGIGSREMEKIGFEIVGRSEELAVVGFKEVLAHYPKIKSVFNRLVEMAGERNPKLVLLLDYPDFNFRLAKKMKRLGLPVVYYISPQLWAWRTGRIKLVKKFIDRMLVVFPFEVDFYKKHNVDVTFVGHPLLEEITEDLRDDEMRKKRRGRFGLHDNDMVLGLMPGSRNSELKNNLATQIEVARVLQKKHPDLHLMLLIAPGLEREKIRELLPADSPHLMLIQMAPFEMLQICDLILCASGTATLMTGLMHVPMVIMYKMNAVSAWLAKTLVKSTKFFGMVNLILGREVVPEKFQEQASVEVLSAELEKYIENRELRSRVVNDLKELDISLGNKGAAKRVTDAIREYLM